MISGHGDSSQGFIFWMDDEVLIAFFEILHDYWLYAGIGGESGMRGGCAIIIGHDIFTVTG